MFTILREKASMVGCQQMINLDKGNIGYRNTDLLTFLWFADTLKN